MNIKCICGKPFCKATFEVAKDDIVYYLPEFCPKCVAQDSYVVWTDKSYEGNRWDDTPQKFVYKIKKYI